MLDSASIVAPVWAGFRLTIGLGEVGKVRALLSDPRVGDGTPKLRYL